MKFFFCKQSSLALPLIALQYHQVKVTIKLRDPKSLQHDNDTAPEMKDIKLYGDYVYLDKDERQEFAQNKHEFLIEQLQKNGPFPGSFNKYDLT